MVPALAVGSFVNTLIVRIPTEEKVFRPGPRCQMCDAQLGPRDLVPVLSWVASRGRCRHCDGEVPVGYPLVEIANVVLWALAAVRFGASWELLAYLALFSILLALSVIDLELYLLPNRLTYPSILGSIALIPVLSLLLRDDPAWSITSAFLGGFGYALFLVVMVTLFELILRKEAMGMGDVKLAVVLGIWVGWMHILLVVYALLFACVLGVVVGAVVLAIRRESRAFPFGPWLALGAIGAILFSEQILDSLNRAPSAW